MSPNQAIQLYRSLIRESKKFPSYNFRNYALRRIRNAFRENRAIVDTQEIQNKLKEGYTSLEVIRRQVIIGQLYSTDKLVIENVA